MSIGFVVGPTIGSGLYELGGFSLPFLALGLLILGSAIVSILLIIFEKKERAKKDQIIGEKGEKVEKEGEEENRKEMDKLLEKKVNLMRMFCIPEIALTLVSLFALEFSLFFYDASLTEHLMPVRSFPFCPN
jgi:MFS family permease